MELNKSQEDTQGVSASERSHFTCFLLFFSFSEEEE